MRYNYTNLPTENNKSKTIKEFEGYQNVKSSTNSSVYQAMTGFFTSNGFDVVSSELISEVIISQAKNDGYNPMQILDSMRSLNEIELSGIVAEILNYNRYKSSSLGFLPRFNPNPEITRNLIAWV
mgnify:CR=1 FL=1